ncbi:MAG TPA: hypothetical protein VEA15_08485 [Caulobacteraceae bacterium]|nr:hypothetical protein [Caulobacteraceae bacterium]
MSSKSTTKTKNTQTLNPWALQQYDRLTGGILDIADNPATPYGGQLSAGPDPLQQQAWAMAQQNVGAGQATLEAAIAAARAAGGYTPMTVQGGSTAGMDLSGYMNPYLDTVAGGYLEGLDRSREMAINTQAGELTRQGAFGGSRHGVADSLTNEAFARQASDGLNNIYSSGFQSAQAAAQADLGRQLQAAMSNQSAGLQGAQLGLSAANALGQFGQQQQQMSAADAGLLNQFGAQSQQYAQAALDAQYQEWLRQQNWPMQQAQLQMGVLNATPWPMNSTGRSETRSYDPLEWAKFAFSAIPIPGLPASGMG